VNHVFILFFFSVKRMVVELKKFLKNCGSIGTIGFRLMMVRWYMEKTERTLLTQRISIYNYRIVFFFFWLVYKTRMDDGDCSSDDGCLFLYFVLFFLSVIRMIYI